MIQQISMKVIMAKKILHNRYLQFKIGKEKGYFLNDGKLVDWRHGFGAFLDYTNPSALDWWHKQMVSILSEK